jgi:DNA-binding PadR family transcriptional regulator
MSAKHALLGLLRQRPAYPYELADRLQARLGPAWAINSGQLYQTVQRLEAEELIERVDAPLESREDRHVFAITELGIEEFEHWFESDTTRLRLPRRPLIAKITLAGPNKLKDALAHIDAYELECARHLSELSRCRDEVSVDGPVVRADHVLLRLGLTADIFHLESELRWARHAHEMVSWLQSREAIWPSAQERFNAGHGEREGRRDAREKMFARMASKHLHAAARTTEHSS